MSISTHGIIPNKDNDSLKEIISIIKKKLKGTGVSHDKKYNPENGVFVNFKYKDEERRLFVLHSKTYEDNPNLKLKAPYIWLSLNNWGSSVEIIRGIVEEFGGFIDENDCDDKDYYKVPKKASA